MLQVKQPEYQPPLVSILAAAANISERLGITLRITDTIGNGQHGKYSFHYALSAVDFGTKEFADTIKEQLVIEFQKALGLNYDVILESKGLNNEHLHVERDAK